MTIKWLALLVLTAFLAVANEAQARSRIVAGDTVAAAADQDFSAKGRYAKKQTDTYQRTKKYR